MAILGIKVFQSFEKTQSVVLQGLNGSQNKACNQLDYSVLKEQLWFHQTPTSMVRTVYPHRPPKKARALSGSVWFIYKGFSVFESTRWTNPSPYENKNQAEEPWRKETLLNLKVWWMLIICSHWRYDGETWQLSGCTESFFYSIKQ